ncbi:MAG: hypothetical protein ILP19_06005 [Oscillospiraceae bacterium]|nr:hypothetical protein [Oscillospiraceae bacterium]
MAKQRLWALIMAAVMMMFIPSGAFGGIVSADDTTETFTINGHGQTDIVKDSEGYTIPGYAYCMDGNASSPRGETFTRMRLSEATDYQKKAHYPRVFTDEVRSRLLKVMVARSDVITFMHTQDLSEHKQWFVDNIDALYDNNQLRKGREFKIDDKYCDYGAIREMHNNGELTDEEFQDYKERFADTLGQFSRNYQYIIWALVHGDAEKDQWVHDDGSVTGSDDRYHFEEIKTWFVAYAVDNPIPGSEEHSLYTAVYKPLMDYLDNELPDYFAEGWDAWVYYIDDEGIQNMIGAAFKDVTIEKVDEEGKGLAGASFELYDNNDVKIDSWVSDGTPHVLKNAYSGKVYTLREVSAPEGYEAIDSDIRFNIYSNYDISSSDRVLTVNKNNATLANRKLHVNISKTDIADGTEVAGATIQMIDGQGNIVEEWVSGAAPHTVEGITPGVTYTLRETVAPEGYTITADTTFSVDEKGVVTTTGTVTSAGVILVEDTKTSVSISKVDVTSSDEIAGAHIQILDEQDNVVEEWTSTTQAHTVEGLATGKTYTLRETVAPEGYTIASDTTFTIAEDGKVTSTGTVSNAGVMLIEDAKTSVSISKVDVTSSEELAGAHIQILDDQDKVVEEWDSTTKAHTVEGLTTGKTYTLRETVAPDGYAVTTDTAFSLKEDGTIDTSKTTAKTENGVILVEDSKTSVKISKVDAAGGEEVAGAHIQILDEQEKVVEEWDSTTQAHVVEGLTADKTYTLRETVAPEGYSVTADTTFTIAADGTVTSTATISSEGVILIADGKNSVKIKKTDIDTSEELPGAVLSIIDESGNTVEEWTSTTEAHEVKGLISGTNYTLRETAAPDGYTIASDISFTIAADGTVTAGGKTAADGLIIVEDKATSVSVSKVDATSSEEVAGAHIQIIDDKGSVVEEWDSTTEAHTVKGLITGKTYTLRETVAPEGYTIASDTTFTIAEDGKVTSTGTVTSAGVLLVADDKTSVKIKKTDIDTSEELPGAELAVIDESGNVVEEWTSTTEAHEIKGLIAGVKYTLRETAAPEGYAVTTDIPFTISADGKVTAGGKTASDGLIVVEDKITAVYVYKVNKYGDSLDGAKMQITDGDGKTVASWTTDGTVYEVKGLKTGVTYTVHEVEAPEGYALAKDVTFKINADGTVDTDGKVQDGAIVVEDLLKIKFADEGSQQGTPAPGTEPTGTMIVRTSTDTPTPGLVASIYPDGTKKTPDERLVTEDESEGDIEEVDSGAAVADSGEKRSETGVFAIITVMAIALAAVVLSRKRVK